jgi:hypothetical protein
MTGEFAEPLGGVTVIGPVVAPAGTMAVIVETVLDTMAAEIALKVTMPTPGKFVPTIVTAVPTEPEGGENAVMVGTCAPCARHPQSHQGCGRGDDRDGSHDSLHAWEPSRCWMGGNCYGGPMEHAIEGADALRNSEPRPSPCSRSIPSEGISGLDGGLALGVPKEIAPHRPQSPPLAPCAARAPVRPGSRRDVEAAHPVHVEAALRATNLPQASQ